MRILLLIGLAATSCGVAESSDGNARAQAPQDDGVAVGRVVCTADGETRVLTPRIRAGREGVRMLIYNRGDAVEFFMRETDSESNHGGRLRDRTTRDVFTHAPGEVWIVCLDRKEPPPAWMDPDPRYATFEIVDPDELWVDYEPECERTDEVRGDPVTRTRSVDELEAWIRERFGIDSGDRATPGYPETGWKLPNWVIEDGDRTIAYFVAVKDDGMWRLLVAEGCA